MHRSIANEIVSFLGKNKVWCCIAKTSYKNMQIKSLGFTSDTSLLGVGFGNTLCVYTPDTLKLRCALSAPCGLDGNANKMLVSVPASSDRTSLDEKRKKFLEKRKKIIEAIQNMIEKNETSTIANQVKNMEELKKSKKSKITPIQSNGLTLSQQGALFSQILHMNHLNLFQKILIFDKINLRGRVPKKWKKQYIDYCERNDSEIEEKNLFGRMLNLSMRHKFKMIHKYKQTITQSQRNRKTMAALEAAITFTNPSEITPTTNGVAHHSPSMKNDHNATIHSKRAPTQNLPIQINHVAFCRGEHSHLVIVCTENRLLIWNLLTLRLQSSFKMSVTKLNVDMYTSLVAAITTDSDLYVFMPNTPIPLYQHKNLPKIEGLAWIPRTYPRPHSLTIDWQANTELYFLSAKQVRSKWRKKK